MSADDGQPASRQPDVAWRAVVARFQQPSTWRASWQLTNTVVPYVVLWYAMYRSTAISWWLTLPLAVVAAGLLVRLFIIFHDCGHGSFSAGWPIC
jgi:omega-6 fatty acid desaturase (delta-12 desaturase)